jgi:ribosomal protein L6P/L9E
VVKPMECLHYALNLPTSVVITGIDSQEILQQAFEAAKTFKPMKRSGCCSAGQDRKSGGTRRVRTV